MPPPTSSAGTLLAGNGPDDLWALDRMTGHLSHHAGVEWPTSTDAWTERLAQVHHAQLLAPAGKNAVFVGGAKPVGSTFQDAALALVSSDGRVRDHSADLPPWTAPVALVSFGDTAYLLTTQEQNTNATTHLLRWDGDRFVNLNRDLPEAVRGPVMTSLQDLWVHRLSLHCGDSQNTCFFRFDGTDWSEIPAAPCGGELMSTLWIFDGATGYAARWTGSEWAAVQVPEIVETGLPPTLAVLPLAPDSVGFLWLDPATARLLGRRLDVAGQLGEVVTLATLDVECRETSCVDRVIQQTEPPTALGDGTLAYPFAFRNSLDGIQAGLALGPGSAL